MGRCGPRWLARRLRRKSGHRLILREVFYLYLKGIIMMTGLHVVGPASVLAEALTESSPDLMRNLLQTTRVWSEPIRNDPPDTQTHHG